MQGLHHFAKKPSDEVLKSQAIAKAKKSNLLDKSDVYSNFSAMGLDKNIDSARGPNWLIIYIYV